MLSLDVYEAGKDALGYIKKKMNEDPELLEKFNELWNSLLTLRDENISLRSQLEEIQKEQDIERRLNWDSAKGVFWLDVNDKKEACCPACWKESRRAVYMKQRNGGWMCPACNYSEIPARKIVKKSRKGWL